MVKQREEFITAYYDVPRDSNPCNRQVTSGGDLL